LNSLNELNKIIESINIDITDDNISDLQNQVSKLVLQFKSNIYKSNQAVTYLFKMLEALTSYLGSKKDKVHADTIPILNSIAEKLEKIINDPELSQSKINAILSKELEKFKFLKSKIASRPVISKNEMNELKASILAIDWEISETTLENFEKVVNEFLSKLKTNKIHYAFLKIIHSIGQYIGIKKANAHTDSVSFLHSVFNNFEQIVLNAGMDVKEKKQFLETEIKNFQDFKNKIAIGKYKNQTVEEISPAFDDTDTNQTFEDTDTTEIIEDADISQEIEDTEDDEAFAPALSQFKESSTTDAESDVSLTTLSKIDEDPQLVPQVAADTSKPAKASQKNVMDDLFTVKESPADELLDAIHMLDVQGENPAQAMNMLDEAEGFQSDGITKFTPQDKSNAPIPEIENRLDEFFNLDMDIPENNVVQDDTVLESDQDQPDKTDDSKKEDQHIDVSTSDDTDLKDGIIPFDDKDESFENIAKQYDDSLKKIIELKSFFNNSDWIEDKASLLSIDEHIAFLEDGFQNDPEKIGLLEIITLNINLLKNQNSEKNSIEKDDKIDKDFEETPEPQVETPGILKKIKNIFT